MSVLETPRIVFGGQMSWDPIVTNNYQKFYNEDTCWTDFEPNETVAQFRQAAAAADSVLRKPLGVGNWNPMGTHRSNFFNTEITGVDLGGGIKQTGDAFISSPASFSGMLVDCEPYGGITSQLFFDVMSLGIDGGCRILLPRTSRFTARYINFFRLPRSVYSYAASVASVVWQTSFPKADGLQIDAFDSGALKSLKAMLDDDDVLGLTVRFNAYATHYYGAETTAEITALENALVANLAAGGFQPNPARSQVVGVVGLWRKGEPASEPGDRALVTLCDPPASPIGPTGYVGTAFARIDSANKLTVDMSNSIPEIDLQSTKQNFGELSLIATGAGGATTQLGTIEYTNTQDPLNGYDATAYRASCGIVTLQLTETQAQAAADGLLSMNAEDGTVLLSEQALRALPNTPNLYIDFGESKNAEVLVLNKGVPAGSGKTVAMELSGSSAPGAKTELTNADGIATFDITGVQGQVEGYVLEVDPTSITPQEGIDPQVQTYMYIRTYPGDDTIAELEPTWENVYKFCLSNWNAMAPCMDNWLDLNDPVQVKAYGAILKKLTDPANFESFRFMPVTRDMTPVERKLLYAFLDGDGSKRAALESAPEEKAPSLADLSRKMRQAE